jgi:hypothetical protein
MRKLFYALAVALVALAVPSCNIFADYGNAICQNDPAGCNAGGSPSGMAACLSPGTSFWECNVVGGPNTVPLPYVHLHPGWCGSFFCASSQADAENQSGAAGDPSLACVPLDAPTPWVACFTPCDPCDDGQGGTLQSVGEHCGNAASGAQCCAGLTCVGYGDTYMGTCQGTPSCQQRQPNWQPLTTTVLRQIAAQNNIGVGLTGIQQSRAIGVAFEAWVLTTLGVVPSPPGPDKNSTLFMSQARKKSTGGLPASVIPEFVGDQTYTVAGMSATFPQSVLYEVKAVTAPLTLGTSNWQILGLLDVANNLNAMDAGTRPAPAVFFITTGNTTVSTGVLTQATMSMWSVAVWQQKVLYDANGGSNPNLTLGPPDCLTPNLCTSSAPVAVPKSPGPPISPLTSPTTPPSNLLVPGDPDPPEVD